MRRFFVEEPGQRIQLRVIGRSFAHKSAQDDSSSLVHLIRLEGRQSLPQELLLDAVGRQREGLAISLDRFLPAIQAAKDISAGSMKKVVAVELARGSERVDTLQAGLESGTHRHR